MAACGGDDDSEPVEVEGGGVTGPAIDGRVNVFVIDDDSDAPIAGAHVEVGAVAGETDEAGLFVATGDLEGPVAITATAAGHVPTTWVGVSATSVTIPLALPLPPADVPEGSVEGTITGWTALAPPDGKGNIALATYTANDDDNDPANDLEQPAGSPPPNACVNLGAPDPTCDFTLRTRTGQMMIYALLGTIDAQQNIEIDGFAYQDEVAVGDGEAVDGLALDMVDAADLIAPAVGLPSAPSGTAEVAAAMRVDLGADGRMSLPVAGKLVAPVPSSSVFPEATYDLIGVASAAEGTAASLQIERRVDPATASLGVFLPLPTGLSTDGSSYAFEQPAGANVALLRVSGPDGRLEWAVAVLDGTTEVVRPESVSLPSETLSFEAQAIEVPGFDPTNFSADRIADAVTRLSEDSVDFTYQ
jgi:hypothetical protein